MNAAQCYRWSCELRNRCASIQDQLLEWYKTILLDPPLAFTSLRNFELDDGMIRVLVRYANHPQYGKLNRHLVIATVCVPEELRRKGWFKEFYRFCTESELWDRVVVEDVENSHLRSYLARMGCKQFSKSFPTTYVSPPRP
jgi:hypothetical protein